MSSVLTPNIAALRAQLDDCEAAIAAAAGGVSYSRGGRSVTRQSLPELREERTRLVREIRTAEAAAAGARSPDVTVATWR